jgi:hypothetical protein
VITLKSQAGEHGISIAPCFRYHSLNAGNIQ